MDSDTPTTADATRCYLCRGEIGIYCWTGEGASVVCRRGGVATRVERPGCPGSSEMHMSTDPNKQTTANAYEREVTLRHALRSDGARCLSAAVDACAPPPRLTAAEDEVSTEPPKPTAAAYTTFRHTCQFEPQPSTDALMEIPGRALMIERCRYCSAVRQRLVTLEAMKSTT